MMDHPTWEELRVGDVFVALHPFLVVPERSPRRDPCGPFTVTPTGRILGQAPDYVRKNPASARLVTSESERQKRLTMGELTKTTAKHVRWEAIKEACDFRAFAEIQRALYSIVSDEEIGNSKKQRLSVLTEYCDANDIFFPTEGFIPPSLERLIGKLLGDADQDEFFIFDEFDMFQAKARREQLLEAKSLALTLPMSMSGTIPTSRFSTPDGRLQFRAMEGSFYTTIKTDYGDLRDKISSVLDGFWCQANEADGWWIASVRAIT